MDTPTTFDLIVIGGGPAGYVGAIRAAQLGMKVACIERDQLGGVCLNWGCIPTKALLAGAEFYHKLKHEAQDWGIHAEKVSHDWAAVIKRSRTVAGTLNKGIGFLFKKNKITHLQGHGQIVGVPTQGGQGSVTVALHDQPGHVSQTLKAKWVLVATGSSPRELPFAPYDGQRIISSKEAMALPTQPEKLIIIGSGPIGMEFAYFYHAYGTRVTVLEVLDRLLPNEDAEVSAQILKSFTRLGIDCRPATKATEVRKTETGVEVVVASVNEPNKKETLVADKVLVAVGVRGRFDGLLSEALKAKLKVEKDHIQVDKKTYATSLPGVYAAGDVIGPPWLAHVASEEAIICVETLAGHHPEPIDYGAIPGCTFCQPQVASLGLTEQACKDKGWVLGQEYKIGKFPFRALGKAQALGSIDGFVKLITDARTGEILGAHMIGENVTDLLAEVGLAKRLEATADELIATMHAHPTLSEAIHEAALGTQNRIIHA